MSDNNRYGGAHLLLAFIAGGITGAAVALLSAPQSGAESRDTLSRLAKNAQGKAVRVPTALRRAYHEASEAAKKAFTESFAESASEKTEG
ncbi:MAG TPA: YtxH domain-containing protein [Candidatus Polarisedimenticolaceae bacterium]|nr:YtxH domain-containing protein [Candidatus Polarisedimenticolaceae bacterium]